MARAPRVVPPSISRIAFINAKGAFPSGMPHRHTDVAEHGHSASTFTIHMAGTVSGQPLTARGTNRRLESSPSSLSRLLVLKAAALE